MGDGNKELLEHRVSRNKSVRSGVTNLSETIRETILSLLSCGGKCRVVMRTGKMELSTRRNIRRWSDIIQTYTAETGVHS